MTTRKQTAVARAWVDTHVHLYPRFDAAQFLDTAHRRLAHAWAGAPGNPAGVLMLTECAGDDGFGRLLAEGSVGDWSVSACNDGVSLRVARGRDVLYVIAGRQVVTKERLEVLALGTREVFDDGQSLDQSLESVLAAEALPVLPYALGKWLGERGKVVTHAIERWGDKGLCLGDNACRPRGLPAPRQFAQARARGLAILPGSDPLNIAGAEGCVGSYGVAVDVQVDADAPAAGVLRALGDAQSHVRSVGRRVSLIGCVRQQLALRQSKREARSGE